MPDICLRKALSNICIVPTVIRMNPYQNENWRRNKHAQRMNECLMRVCDVRECFVQSASIQQYPRPIHIYIFYIHYTIFIAHEINNHLSSIKILIKSHQSYTYVLQSTHDVYKDWKTVSFWDAHAHVISIRVRSSDHTLYYSSVGIINIHYVPGITCVCALANGSSQIKF